MLEPPPERLMASVWVSPGWQGNGKLPLVMLTGHQDRELPSRCGADIPV